MVRCSVSESHACHCDLGRREEELGVDGAERLGRAPEHLAQPRRCSANISIRGCEVKEVKDGTGRVIRISNDRWLPMYPQETGICRADSFTVEWGMNGC